MKNFKRKDKLIIVIIALACLIMTIANPHEYSIRDLAWNYALLLLFSSGLFWIFSEISDVWTSFSFRYDQERDTYIRKRKKNNLDGLTRDQLLSLAGECSGGADLSSMSDEDLARFIMARNGVELSGKKSKVSFIVRLYKTFKFIYISIRILYIKLYKFVKELPSKFKKDKKKKKTSTINDLVKERDKIIKELSE